MRHSTYNYFFGNLSNPLKIDIISALKAGSLGVGEIVREIGEEQSRVSHALSDLKACNLVMSEKKGKRRIYSLNKKTLLPILQIIDRHARDYCNKTKCIHCKML